MDLASFIDLLRRRPRMLMARLRYSKAAPMHAYQLRREWKLLLSLAAAHERACGTIGHRRAGRDCQSEQRTRISLASPLGVSSYAQPTLPSLSTPTVSETADTVLRCADEVAQGWVPVSPASLSSPTSASPSSPKVEAVAVDGYEAVPCGYILESSGLG